MRRLSFEYLERRDLMACDAVPQYDTNLDGNVTAVDVLVVINHLNANGGSTEHNPWADTSKWLDVNLDGNVTPADVLVDIDYLNTNGTGPQPTPLCLPTVVSTTDTDAYPLSFAYGAANDVITFDIENLTPHIATVAGVDVAGVGVTDVVLIDSDTLEPIDTVQPNSVVHVRLRVTVEGEEPSSQRITMNELWLTLENGETFQSVVSPVVSPVVFYSRG